MSAMPLLRTKVSALFGKEPRRDVDGQGTVARGAALLGHSLTLREQGLGLKEVLSAAIYTELPSGELREVFERHTALPWSPRPKAVASASIRAPVGKPRCWAAWRWSQARGVPS